MTTEKNKFYVTTPIYYVTAKPHLGHLYSTVIADVLARWNKLQNKQVFFLTGTDEFGQKIAQAAAKEGKAPQEFVDSFIDTYKEIWRVFEIDYTIFMRTTNKFHIEAVQKWIVQLMAKGDIYKSFYSGWYCTPDETFVTEESNAAQAPLCPSCGRITHRVSEEAYFFKLSAYQDQLLEWYAKNPTFIIPQERSQEVINFVKSGLKDLSISRTTVQWGVPFPGDDKHVTYVWADALNNYITAIGWGQPGKEKEFKSWWPADVQVMGKDILRFHAIYWPAFLMASGLELPKHLLVHGWFKVGAQKMSKSFGNVIDPMDLYKVYGADAVRYYLMRQMAVTHDGEFNIDDLEQKIGSDLADDLGNLLNRMTTLAQKYNISQVQKPQSFSPAALEIHDARIAMVNQFQKEIDAGMFHMALAALWKFIKLTNAYFHNQEPWKVAQKDLVQFNEILWVTAHSLRTIGVMLWPVMPAKMEALLSSIGIAIDFDTNIVEELKKEEWNTIFMLKKIDTLFEKPEITDSKQDVNSVSKDPALLLQDKTITIDEFAKVQLTVGTIQECQEISQSDKLYKLQVDFGPLGKRQILSGVRKYFKPEELIGKQAVFVLNLAPRKMMGLESQGMLLTAAGENNTMSILSPNCLVPNGTCLK